MLYIYFNDRGTNGRWLVQCEGRVLVLGNVSNIYMVVDLNVRYKD
jgi:hypothetical protein